MAEENDDDDFKITKIEVKKKDGVLINPNSEVLFKHPGRCVISGASGSGKTNFICNILIKKNMLKGYFDIIFLISPNAHIDEEWDSVSEIQDKYKFEDLSKDTLDKLDKIFDAQAQIVKENGIDKAPRLLFIFDDVIANDKVLKHPVISKIITRGRHNSASIFIASQSYMKVPRLVRINATNLFIFGTANIGEKKRIADEQTNPMLRNEQEFYDIFDYCCKERYGFMTINNQCDKKDQYRKNLDTVIDLETFCKYKR